MKGKGREEKTCPALRSPDKSRKLRFSAFPCVTNLPDSSNEKIKPSTFTFLAPLLNISYITPRRRRVFSEKQSILLEIDPNVLSGEGRAVLSDLYTIEIEWRWA
ncbi:uncharacterized [Tachysurus ichikawai]